MKALAGFSPIPSPVLGKLKHFKSQTDLSAKAATNPQQSSNFVDLHMHSAVISGNIGMIRFALDNGQSIHSSINGLQAIHVAAGFGQLAILKYLISRGANVNCRRGSTMPDGTEINNEKIKGPTPLHFAASNGHLQVVEYLLERGADPDIEDQYGCTPIDIALAQGYSEIYKLLVDNSTIQGEMISVPQMPSSMSNAFKPSPKIVPGSPSSQSMPTPKLQYQRKTSTPTIIYQNKPSMLTRAPMTTSPPEYSSNYSKSPKIHNIKGMPSRSPVLSSSQSKSPILNSRFNVVYNPQEYVQPRIRRGISEKNIKQIGNDDLIYDTQKVSKNNMPSSNSPLIIKDGNITSASYQVSSSNSYLNNNDSYPTRSDSAKSANTFRSKNPYEGTSNGIDNSESYYNDLQYPISDSEEEYFREGLNDSMLEKYTDSYSDSEIMSPSSLFNASPPKSMTQLYHKNSSLFKGKNKRLSRSNSASSNQRKYSNGSLKISYESDREQNSKNGENSSSQIPKSYTRSRSNSRTDPSTLPTSYYRSRSNSRSEMPTDPTTTTTNYRSRSNSKAESTHNFNINQRSRSNSNSKLEVGVKNTSSNYHLKTNFKDKANTNTNEIPARTQSRSRSRSHSRSEHYSKSKSRSNSRSVSRSRSNSQSIVNSKLSNNTKLSSSNVNTINTIFTFANMKSSLNSPQSDKSPNIPSSYSSDFSVGSISDKDILLSPSPAINYSNSMTSTSTSVMNTTTYTPSLKSSVPDNLSMSSSYAKNKSKYPNYTSNLNSYSNHLYSSSQAHLPPSKIPLSAKASKSSLDPNQPSYNSLKNITPCFPEGVIRNRSHSNSQVPTYTGMGSTTSNSRARSYSNNTIPLPKSSSPYIKPIPTMTTTATTTTNSNIPISSNSQETLLKPKYNDSLD